MVSSTAPGKIILFGEHAVVYGQPALAVPVTQVRATATAEPYARPGIWIAAPDIDLHSDLSSLSPHHPLAAVVLSVLSELAVPDPPPLKLTITSTIPVASGLGSGAAVSVAVIRTLSSFLGHPLPDERVSSMAYEIEKLHHGTPSGIDNTVITYTKPVYFLKGKPVEIFHIGTPFTILIGYTGIPAPTKESVADVRTLWASDQPRWDRVFAAIGALVIRARQAIESGDLPLLGQLMDRDHALLQELTVSSPELDRLVAAARDAGALGAKLSGGGRGGNMIALLHPQQAEQVSQALLSAGATQTILTRIE